MISQRKMPKRLVDQCKLLFACFLFAASQSPSGQKKVVGAWHDGMDPKLLQTFVEQGRMPNFKALMQEETSALCRPRCRLKSRHSNLRPGLTEHRGLQRAKSPSCIRALKFGMRPCSTKVCNNLGSIPSMPSTHDFFAGRWEIESREKEAGEEQLANCPPAASAFSLRDSYPLSRLLGERRVRGPRCRKLLTRLRRLPCGHDRLPHPCGAGIATPNKSSTVERCRRCSAIHLNRSIAEKHAWNLGRVHVVITCPGPRVIGDHFFSEAARHGLPCDAIARGETDTRSGGLIDVRTFVG